MCDSSQLGWNWGRSWSSEFFIALPGFFRGIYDPRVPVQALKFFVFVFCLRSILLSCCDCSMLLWISISIFSKERSSFTTGPGGKHGNTSQHGSAPWCWWSFWTSEYSAGPRPRHPNRKNCGKTVFDCCIYCIFLFGTDLDSLTCFNTHVGSPGIGRWAVSNPAPVGWCWSNWAPGARWRGSWPWCVAPSTAASGTGQTGLRPWPWRIGETKMGYQNPGENDWKCIAHLVNWTTIGQMCYAESSRPISRMGPRTQLT